MFFKVSWAEVLRDFTHFSEILFTFVLRFIPFFVITSPLHCSHNYKLVRSDNHAIDHAHLRMNNVRISEKSPYFG